MKTQNSKILFGILCVFSGIGITEATFNPPIAVVMPTSQTATVGQTVFFADGGSYDPDYGQTIVARAWTFPSQAVMINNYDSTSTYCKFNAAGTFTVNLKVQDNTGQWSTTGANCTVTVTGSVSTWYVSVSGDDVTNNGQTSGTPFHRIQTAIDCASNGNVIEVAEGNYYENINFRGKTITVKSTEPENPAVRANTVIDGYGAGAVVSFSGAETSSAMLQGITIRGGGIDTEQFKAHWSFDSNAEDAEGNHHGTFNGNAIITTATGQYIVGAGALSLDGDNDYVQVGNSNDLNFGAAQALSISAWIKTSYSAGNQRIVFKKNDSFEGYTLTVVATTGKARLNVKGIGQSTATYVDSTTTVTDGQWHHLVGVRDADANIKMYVDGLLEATVSTSTMDLTNSFPLYIGIDNQYGGLTNDFNGKIDDVRIYGRALSAEDIRVLMMSAKIVSAAHWKLDEGTGTTASDSSENNHSLTLPNSPYQPTWTGGILDSSLNFDGTDDYVDATGYTGISGTNARTTAAWIRTTDTIGPIVYWGDKDTTGGLWDMRVSSTGKLRVLAAGGPAIDGSTTINTGQWVHVAAVLPQGGNNTNQILLYVNGILETGTTVTAGTINTVSDVAVRMGANETGHFYAGQIDDIRIYSEALSAERVRALAAFPGPEAHWKLDETSGTTASDSGPQGLTGSLQNMDGNSDWVNGVSGNSLEFDGTDDYVAVTNYTGISGSRARTTAAWIKTTDTIGPIVYWGNKDATGGLWDMRVSNTGKLRLLAAGGPAVDGSTTINTGQWVHVAAVLPEGKSNAGDILLYVNGVLETGVTVTAGTINTGVVAAVRIGANETTHYFAGQMDEVRIYRRPLTAEEIRELACGGGGIRGFGTAAAISRCVIENNMSSMDGGGIWDVDGTISQCLIRGNSAVGGGGLAACGTDTSDSSSILNCIVADNDALYGGGMADCTAKIRNCTIVNNTAPTTGGLLNCPGSIINCIVWGNHDDLFNSPNVSYSCVQNLNVNEITEYSTAHIHHRNPNLDSDYHLQIPSYCINHGNNDGGICESGETDIDADSRCINGCVDIGADEFSAANLLFVEPGGYTTIQAAINASVNGDVVVVMPGVWTGDGNRDLTFGGRKIAVQSSNPTDPAVVAATVIDCQGTMLDPHRGFIVEPNEMADFVIDGLTIRNGYGSSNVYYEPKGWVSSGGAIYCRGQSATQLHIATIRNCVFVDNKAGFWGGAIHMMFSTMQILNCSFINNEATEDTAGAVYAIVSPNIVIRDCTFIGNKTGGGGGAFRTQACPNVQISNCLFEKNRAQNSAAVSFQEDPAGGGSTILKNCQFYGNIASRTDTNQVGVIAVGPYNSLTMDNCVLSGNIIGNNGGVVYVNSEALFVSITNCSIVGNTVASGAGLYCGRTVEIANTIIWGNRNPSGNILDAQIQGICTNINYSCVEDALDDDQVIAGDGNIDSDPTFLSIPNDGGDGFGDDPATANMDEGLNDDYGDLRLLPGSPCIDVGANSIEGVEIPTTDILGVPRPLLGKGTGTPTVDMGAYEYCGNVWVEAGPDKTVWLTAGNPVATVHIEGTIQSSAELEPSILPRWSVRTTEPWGLDSLALTNEPVGGVKGHVDAAFDRPGQYTMLLEAVTPHGKAVASDMMVVKVEPYGGTLPIVDAGPAPTNCVDGWYPLLGKVTDDGRPNGHLDIQWTMINAPANCWVEFENPKSEKTKVHFRCEGTYSPDPEKPFILMLSATDGTLDEDDNPIYKHNTVEICVDEVEELPAQGPRVFAGEDSTNEIEATSSYDDQVDLDGTLLYPTDPAGVTFEWTQVGGPVGCAQIASPTSLNTPISFTRKGDYTFRLTAKQGDLTGYDEVRIQVQFPYNVSAGEYEDIRLPKPLLLDTVNAADVGTDKDVWIQDEASNTKFDTDDDTTGLPDLPSGVEVTWSMVKGPGRASFNPPYDPTPDYPDNSDNDATRSRALNPEVQFSKAGKYTLRLSAGTPSGQTLASDEVEITALPGKLIAAGKDCSFVVGENGSLFACGSESNGRLGNGQGAGEQTFLVYVHAGEQNINPDIQFQNVKSISAGLDHVLVLDNEKYPWSFGANYDTQLGYGVIGDSGRFKPGKVYNVYGPSYDSVMSNICQVSTGSWNDPTNSQNYGWSFALDANGNIWSWGNGHNSIPSALGRTSETIPPDIVDSGEQSTAQWVHSDLENIISISSKGKHSLAIEKNEESGVFSRVFSWGEGTKGQLGSGQYISRQTPVIVIPGMQGPHEYLKNIVSVSAGFEHSIALELDSQGLNSFGRVYAWGESENGRLGIGNVTSDQNAPCFVIDSTENVLEGIREISAGHDFSLALDNNGHVWAWGNNSRGQLGIGNTSSGSNFAVQVKMKNPNGEGVIPFGDHCEGHILSISAGYDHCLALDAEGTVWAWGDNARGQLGIGAQIIFSTNDIEVALGYFSYPVRMKIGKTVVVNLSHPTLEPYTSIQAAINAANDEPTDHDTILVYPGEYYENVDFGGKDLTLTSLDPDDPEIVASTIINGGGGGTAVTINSNGTNGGTIKGFTICGGSWGIQIADGSSEVRVEKNRVVSNEVGIETIRSDGNPNIRTIISDNEIAFNEVGVFCGYIGFQSVTRNRIVDNFGAGLICDSCSDNLWIYSNLISRNGSGEYNITNARGGFVGQDGVVLYGSGGKFFNNTIINNTPNGIHLRLNGSTVSNPQIRNCILWGNGSDPEHNLVLVTSQPSVPIYHCCIDGTATGNGNIFAESGLTQDGYVLGPGSPCIDAGDNSVYSSGDLDIANMPRKINDIIDIGAYEYPSRVVTAGKDKVLVLSPERDSVRLSDASVTHHAFTIPTQEGRTFEWSCTSGQTTGFTFGAEAGTTSTSLNPTITFTLPGIYVFKLTASENSQVVAFDKVKVTVLPGVKVQLKEGANLINGPIYQSLLSNDSGPTLTLQGLSCYYDNGNQIVNWQGDIPEEFSIEWSSNSPFAGLEEANVPDAQNALTPTITVPAEPGQYTVTLSLKNPGGRVVGSDSITINANRATLTIRADTSAPVGRPATVDGGQAGATIDLYGMAAGGRIDHFEWIQLAGPAEATIAEAESLITTAVLPQPGVYEFGLLAKVDDGETSSQTVGFASVEAELVPGKPLLRIADREDAANSVDVVRVPAVPSGQMGVVNLYAILEGGQWDHVEWEWVESPGEVEPVIGGTYSNQTWITFSANESYTIQAKVWGVEGTEPLVTRQVVVCVGDCDPDDITPGDPSGSGVEISIEPSNAIYELSRTTPLPLRADLSSGTLPAGATIRWHLAGYRNGFTETNSGAEAQIGTLAAMHNYTTWSPSVRFSAAGIYTVAVEVFDQASSFICSDTIEITVTYPNIMVRAWIEKEVGVDVWKPDGKFRLLNLSEPNPNIQLNGSVTFDDTKEHDVDIQWSVLVGSQSVGFSVSNSLPTTATFTQPGIYTIAMVAMSGGVAVGMDTVTVRAYSTASWTGSVVHAGNDKMAILSGTQNTAEIVIGDAIVLPEPASGIVWSCDPPTGVSFDNPAIINPTVTFPAERQYVLNLAYDGRTDTANVTVYPQSKGLVVDAGSYDKVVLPKALLLSDAKALSAIGEPTYEWRVTAPVGADVVFYPSANMLNPQVSFPKEGSYNLQLKVTVTAGGTKMIAVDSTLIEVEKAETDTTPPTIQNFSAQDSGLDSWKISLTASDEKSGVRTIELQLNPDGVINSDDETLVKTIRIPSPNPFLYILDYEFHGYEHNLAENQSVTFSARAWDGYGNPSNWILMSGTISKEGAIRNVQVTPRIVTGLSNPTILKATVPAGTTWAVWKGDDEIKSSEVLLTDHETLIPVDNDWMNGFYFVRLENGSTTIDVPFDVAIGLSSETLVAEITEPKNVPAIDDFGQVKTNSTVLKRISTGTLTVSGSAGFNGIAGAEYRVDLIDGDANPANLPATEEWTMQAESYRVKTCTKGPSGDGWMAGSVENATLATVDLTDVANGVYEILLTARVKLDGRTVTAQDHARFILDCPLKIGNVTFSQEDLTIPVAGIPLTVVRTYNSFNRHREGDFGYGWELSFANLDIKLNEGRSEMDGWTQRNGEDLARDVTLTMPDGKRVTFAAKMTGTKNSSILIYESPVGVDATLVTSERVELIYGGGLGGVGYFWRVGSEDFMNDTTINEAINLSYHDIPGWILTTQDGTVYTIARSSYGTKDIYAYSQGQDDPEDQGDLLYSYQAYGPAYLKSVTTKSGETLVFTISDEATKPKVTGVKAYASDINWETNPDQFTSAIHIDRNDEGQITKIYPPDQLDEDGDLIANAVPLVEYDYDEVNGNLDTVTKRVDTANPDKVETTKFLYNGMDSDDPRNFRVRPSDHFVVGIADDRGLKPIRYVYDDQGRLIETINAQNHRISLSHDVSGQSETVKDRSENETVYKYNSRGNVVEVIRYQGTAMNGLIQTHTLYEYPVSGKNIDKPTKVSQLVDWTDDNPAQPVYAVTETTFGTAELVSPGGTALSVDTETVVDPALNKTVNYTDAYGRLIKTTQYKPIGENQYVELASTWNTYDSETGLLLVTETTTGSGSNLKRHAFTANVYDAQNHLLHMVGVDTQKVTGFSAYYSLTTNESNQVTGIPDTDRQFCIVTSYQYDDNSESPDQPYAVTDPYCPGDAQNLVNAFTSDTIVKRYSKYDSEGRQLESWYEWIVDATHKQQIVNETIYDLQGRVTSTERHIYPCEYIDSQWVRQAETVDPVTLSVTTYNSIGKPDTTEDENHIVTKYWYDQTGNLVETEVYAVYDEQTPANNVLLTTTRTLFDAEGRAMVTVGPYAAGDTPVGTETVYDALGRVSRTNRWENAAITVANVCKPGTNIVVGKKATGCTSNGVSFDQPAAELLSSTATDYDVAGRVYRSYAPTQSTTEKGVCTQEIHYDAAGRQVEVISLPDNAASRAVTVTHYDGPRQDWTRDARNNVTSFEYDALGRVVRTIHPATAYKVVDDDDTIQSASGPVYSHVGYDGFGRKLWETMGPVSIASADDIPANQRKWYSYDAAGRLTKVKMPAVDDPSTTDDDTTWTCPVNRYFYDAYGNQIAIVDPLGRVTRFVYNELNLLKQKYQPFEAEVSDDATTADILGLSLSGKLYEAKTYNSQGRIQIEMDCEGHSTVYRYYKNAVGTDDHFMGGTPSTFLGIPGQLRVEESYDGVPDESPDGSIAYTYDKLGRKKAETVTPGTDVYKTWYDTEGRVEVLESPQGDLLYEYDSTTGAKKATTSYPAGMDADDIRTDAAPGQNQYAQSTTRTVYTYDDLGRLFTVQVTRRNGVALTEAATTYGYNDNGSRESVLLPNGVSTQYEYNGMNRLTEVVHFQTQPTPADPNKPQLSRFLYRHYADGQRASAWERQKPVNNIEKLVLCRYDGLNRLSYESHYEVNSTGYGYRAKYAYDLAGNRTERRVEVKNASGTTTLTAQYAYDSGNDRLQTETHVNTLPFTALPWGADRIYAYAGPGGSVSYGLPGSEKRIGPFGAFVAGLPSVWNRVAMILLAALLPLAALGPMLAQVWRRMRGAVMDGPRPTLSLYHRCLCVLLAYIFLIGPETFVQLANSEVNYSTLSTQAWGQGDRTIEYGYDDNGAQVRKTTKVTSTQQTLEEVIYEYDLRGQLKKVTTTPNPGTPGVTEYKYNPQGIRVWQKVGTTETKYLVDPYNHTGYAQVLEEWTGGSTPAVTYTIGDDVISQSVGTTVSHFLYDGHGSTRQLTNHPIPPTLPTASGDYSYDGYGIMLGDATTPNPAQTAATKYLYAGEQYDKSLSHYYLRARYYNPSNGRFNQIDPFAGNPSDPQSLHKYLYAHCNPVNATDPLGLFSIPEINVSMVINTAMRAWTGYSIYSTANKIYREGIGSLSFFDWLFLGLDVLHVSSAVSWLTMTSIWKKQAQLFHNLGDALAKAVGRARSSITGQLGTQMHEALKASWLGRSVTFLQRQLAGYGISIYLDQAIGTRIGGRPDITIIVRKLKIGIAFEMKPVPKATFYSGILPSYKYLFEQTGRTKLQRESAIQILRQDYGVACLYFYIPYPSFVL